MTREEDIMRAVEDSGEKDVKQAPRYSLPMVQLQGKDGIFLKLPIDDDGNFIKENGKSKKENLGAELSGVILKIRRQFGAFKKGEFYFTNEHNSFKDKLILINGKKTKDGTWKKMAVDEGFIDQLKQHFPDANLKMKQILYFLLDSGEIVKLVVKGAGLAHLFDYYKEFTPKEHLFQFKTLVGCVAESNDMGNYFSTTFTRAEGLDDKKLDEVLKRIFEVSGKIKEVESHYAEAKTYEEDISEEDTYPSEPQYEARKVGNDDIPVIEEGSGYKIPPDYMPKEDDIDVEKIPF